MKSPETLAEAWAKQRTQRRNGTQLVYLVSELALAEDSFMAGYKAAQPRWISVTEALPEPSQVVMIYGPEILWWAAHIVQDHDGWMWVGPLASVHPDEVTHWLPLPDDPLGAP